MRVLHVYKDYFPVLGGIENHIKVLAEAHAAAGHQVTVLVCAVGSHTRVEELNGVRVIKAGRLATVASMPLSVSQLLILSRLQADVVHIHSPYPLGELANWLLGRAPATIITHHSDIVRQAGWLRLYGPLLRRILSRADRIIATSPRYIDTSPWLRPVRDRCVVVPLGVDHRRFTPPPSPFDGPPTVLFVGRLRYYKGVDTLLRALQDLPDVCLNIVGDGPMRDRWEALAVALDLTGRVRFLGEVEDNRLPSLYHQAHLFVLPANARAEAFGTVLLEAMASGLPCVTTEVGTGTSWVVQDGITGLVVPPDDPVALAEAVRWLLSRPRLRMEMGRRGRERVEARFTLDRMIGTVARIYEDVLDRRVGGHPLVTLL
ncbi:MAG TPA: glycosyltransferase [Anaerolineales bacterium]|nr:glycosyltransferase [Anaerolineae bacterium]HIP86903.1 glycosyltransferase [Anaerolineales bacterium]